MYWFVNTLAKRLAGKNILITSFVSNGLPYKDLIKELFVVMVSFCSSNVCLSVSMCVTVCLFVRY